MTEPKALDVREYKPCRKCGGRRMRLVTWSTPSSVTFTCGCRDCGETASYIHIDGMLVGFRVKDVPIWEDYEATVGFLVIMLVAMLVSFR